ncbi:histidine kinase [Sphingomonas panacis]|uniref:histidine kinase n=1 Tax=Sphingomonas panacis TaxID=1560345 RepID=A0A1B3ZAH3_9SPHN|nr:ATP-binding protein [Sphingomonas panacis]AOH84422.1 histidine kinase [Sphingomonas panacis]
MSHRRAPLGHRVLVSAPYGRDAASVSALLAAQGYDACICASVGELASALDDRTGVVLVTEEALRGGLEPLQAALDGQPAWSDIPFILLASRRDIEGRSSERARLRIAESLSNTIVLERPIGTASLLSAVGSAMRSRQRQFDMRDRLHDLAKNEERLRLATSAADIGTWEYDPGNDVLIYDARCKALFGLPADAEVTYRDSFVAGLHEEDRERALTAVEQSLDPDGDGHYNIEYRTIGLQDKVTRWINARGRTIRDAAGRLRFLGTVVDISARKQAEAALAESQAALRREGEQLDQLNRTLEQKVAERTAELEAEMASRSRVEAALRQSQKMEAVGQLTGGIAHDFNNMLTGVIGAMDIMKRRLASGRTDDLERFMDAAATSAQRAAALTARLLAFSRRQSLDTKPTDINALAQSLDDLLRRSIRENIALDFALAPDLPLAMTDANQFESAILNLTINARDAMPEGGQLTIETHAIEFDTAYTAVKPDIEPGRYVMIGVSDTGVGMTPEVLEKVFEPFFSTKPTGQGTGLGLSMVYGFARQSGGQVRIHSRPGQGTSVKIYLPIAEQAPVAEGLKAPPLVIDGHGQTVLLVEDDQSVRLLVRDVLEELRYHTIEASDADAALPILQSDQHIDLMVSDVGLPGMNGRQLAEVARAHRPDLPILFVTGYAENAAIRSGFLGTNMAMITKPFAIEALSAKIAEMVAS